MLSPKSLESAQPRTKKQVINSEDHSPLCSWTCPTGSKSPNSGLRFQKTFVRLTSSVRVNPSPPRSTIHRARSQQRWIRSWRRTCRGHRRSRHRWNVLHKRDWPNRNDPATDQRCLILRLVLVIRISTFGLSDFKKNQAGHIINIGSIAGREPYAGGSIYTATKHAVHAFTASLMREVVNTPIRVTEIQPGIL